MPPITKSLLFPYGSPSELYQKIATQEERHTAEHPYEYIQRVYAESTANSKLTGLPGYSPPWFVRLLNGATLYASYITIILTLQFVFTVLLSAIAKVIELISTVRFTVEIPYTGWEIYTLSPASSTNTEAVVIVMTPILLSFLFFWGWLLVFWSLNRISKAISNPYEKEYIEWLDEIEPTNTAFPPGLAYIQRDKDLFEDTESLPKSIPPAFRELQTFEKIVYLIKAVKLTIWTFFFSTILWQNQVLIQQTGWVDGVETKGERKH